MKRILLVLTLLVAIVNTSLAQDKGGAQLSPDKWPTTVQAAVADLLKGLPESDKQIFRETKERDLIRYHHGWGTGIRNSFGLWRGNNALREDACGKGCHPDDASMAIIEAVWRSLQPPANNSSKP